MASNMDRRIGRLRQGDHLCLIYDSAAEKLAALVPFLRTGLSRGERALFLGRASSCHGMGGIERALESEGIPVGSEIDRGALVLLDDRDSWLDRGRFDPNLFKDLLRRAEQQAMDDGFSGLRATWDVTWLLEGVPGADRWIELEAGLNGFLAGSRTAALCRYARPRSSPALLQDVLRTHPLALLGHQVCPNAFYEPPEMVIGGVGASSPEERVDWMIAQIRRARVSEEKLEELSIRLAQKGAALERADRAKEEFLAMLAHELRNPLGTISNAIQVLRLKGDEGDETWHRAIDAAERQVLHQALLVDDLLEASRVTRGEVELHCESLDLAELARETVEGYRETLRNARLELDLELPDGPLPARGDRLRLSQALANLLHNAAKFTPPGGRVTVRARRAEGRRVELSVRDTGQGIAPEVLPHIFDVFTQADQSLDRARGGLGIGLAVVRGLVEMHGGEVRAASGGLGEGSELTLFLPLDQSVAAPAPVPEIHETLHETLKTAEVPHPGTRRILVVEDNADAASTLRDFLELSGHEVELANSGIDGVQAARQFHPEIVLCDLGLPGMTGYEVAAALRRDPDTASARLIAVTGYGREEDRRKSKEAGFDLHLTKPVDPVQLRRLLQTDPARQATPPEPPPAAEERKSA
ncbi:MAG TPA: MEDS domain-containing protein [Thermoanaerobaculia bacterium]|nr:MEDS domain-containing protein [Thermoanaerobaculia bacterium]